MMRFSKPKTKQTKKNKILKATLHYTKLTMNARCIFKMQPGKPFSSSYSFWAFFLGLGNICLCYIHSRTASFIHFMPIIISHKISEIHNSPSYTISFVFAQLNDDASCSLFANNLNENILSNANAYAKLLDSGQKMMMMPSLIFSFCFVLFCFLLLSLHMDLTIFMTI